KTHLFAPDNIRRVARGLIEKAHAARLISLELFGSGTMSEEENAAILREAGSARGASSMLVERLLPSTVQDALAGWIRVLDPHFVDHYVSRIKPEEKEDWRQRLNNVLLDSVDHDLSLTGVSFSLLAGDPAPFARSSFRSSSSMIPSVTSWLAA